MKVAIVLGTELNFIEGGTQVETKVAAVFFGEEAKAQADAYLKWDRKLVKASEKRAKKGDYHHYHRDSNLNIIETDTEADDE